MKFLSTLLALVILALGHAPSVFAAGPEQLQLPGKLGTVVFEHLRHQQRTSCITCHHKGQEAGACRDCHGLLAEAPGARDAFHRLCKGCHLQRTGPTGCNDCHTQNKP